MKKMIDPPNGWMYGFPKELDKKKKLTSDGMKKWLVENGYPQAELDKLGIYFHWREWTEPD